MDVNNINCILDAFSSVLPQLGMQNIQKAGLNVKGRYIDSPGVMIIIGISGDIKGSILYGLSEESAKKIASKMMMGAPVDTLDELAQSAISELVNMLTATASTNFSNQNIKTDISTPTLICGDSTANTNSDKVICVNMVTDNIPIDVNIALEQS